jgi:hypothetical protein
VVLELLLISIINSGSRIGKFTPLLIIAISSDSNSKITYNYNSQIRYNSNIVIIHIEFHIQS